MIYETEGDDEKGQLMFTFLVSSLNDLSKNESSLCALSFYSNRLQCSPARLILLFVVALLVSFST